MRGAFKRMMAPMANQVAMAIGRAVLQLVNDGEGVQLVQLTGLDGETADDVEHFQAYGLTSVPLPGAEGLYLAVGGQRGAAVAALIGDERHRPTGLQPGEVCLYDDQGQQILISRDRIKVVTTKEVLVEAPKLLVTASAEVTVTAPKVVVISNNVNLGGEGGQRVARIGDAVAGGVITGGSNKVRAT